MSKSKFNLIIALLSGLITALCLVLFNRYGLARIAVETIFLYTALAVIVAYLLFIPSVFGQIKHLCCDYDWAEESVRFYKGINATYRKSFWITFGLINLAFLFHTINFMWGNEDWAAVRYAVDNDEMISHGAFSAYWLQTLLFDGKILPVINNLWSFAGLSLAAVMLAAYWELPKKTAQIVTCGLLFTVTPYTLSILYYAKTSLGVCFLPAIALTALLLSEKNKQANIRSYSRNIGAVLLFLIALGTYMPVINFIAVAFVGKIFIKTLTPNGTIKTAASHILQGLSNFIAALMIYGLIIFLLKENNRLAPAIAATVTTELPLTRLTWLLTGAVTQFVTPLPFMNITYKALYLIFTLLALFTLIFYAPKAKIAARGLILIPLLLIASVLSIAFMPDPNTHLARMTFFGLPFIFALLMVMMLKLGSKNLCRIAYILTALIIFTNFIRVSYAQKVWKFGWDAETKLAERIITRLEKMPDFDIARQYKLLQIGEKSLRPKYYQSSPYEVENNALLAGAYYPAGKAKDAYNFFYQTDFLSADATKEAFQDPEIRRYILNRARPWPAVESIYIHGNHIVLILDEVALAQAQKYLTHE